MCVCVCVCVTYSEGDATKTEHVCFCSNVPQIRDMETIWSLIISIGSLCPQSGNRCTARLEVETVLNLPTFAPCGPSASELGSSRVPGITRSAWSPQGRAVPRIHFRFPPRRRRNHISDLCGTSGRNQDPDNSAQTTFPSRLIDFVKPIIIQHCHFTRPWGGRGYHGFPRFRRWQIVPAAGPIRRPHSVPNITRILF